MNTPTIATLLFQGNEFLYRCDKALKKNEWHDVMNASFYLLENYQNLNEFILTLDAKTRIVIDDMINSIYHIVNAIKKEKSNTKKASIADAQIKFFRKQIFWLTDKYSKS